MSYVSSENKKLTNYWSALKIKPQFSVLNLNQLRGSFLLIWNQIVERYTNFKIHLNSVLDDHCHYLFRVSFFDRPLRHHHHLHGFYLVILSVFSVVKEISSDCVHDDVNISNVSTRVRLVSSAWSCRTLIECIHPSHTDDSKLHENLLLAIIQHKLDAHRTNGCWAL